MTKNSSSYAQLEAIVSLDYQAYPFAVRMLGSNPETKGILDWLSPENTVFKHELSGTKLSRHHRLLSVVEGDIEYLVVLDEKFQYAKIVEIETVDLNKSTEVCVSISEVSELNYVMEPDWHGHYVYKKSYPMALDNVTLSSADVIDGAFVENMKKLFYRNDGFEEAMDILSQVQAWLFKEQ